MWRSCPGSAQASRRKTRLRGSLAAPSRAAWTPRRYHAREPALEEQRSGSHPPRGRGGLRVGEGIVPLKHARAYAGVNPQQLDAAGCALRNPKGSF